jgi:hypothetical protein
MMLVVGGSDELPVCRAWAKCPLPTERQTEGSSD